MNIRKTLFSVLITAFMVSFGVKAAQITSLSEITDMSGTYELTADIILNESFIPIGTKNEPFMGALDGNEHTVSGTYSSIFAYTENAEIKNLNAVDVSLVSDSYFGGIVGYAGIGTAIENCSFSGVVTSSYDGLFAVGGGIAGQLSKNAYITNCFANISFNVTEKPYELYFGGISGRNNGLVRFCVTEGTIVANSDKYRINVGGIAGENCGTGRIEGCLNETDISGIVTAEAAQIVAGGISGSNNGGEISRAVNFGNIIGEGYSTYPAHIGGITGINLNGAVETAKNSGNINAVRSFAGGISGINMGLDGTSYIIDTLNMGFVTKLDSIAGGITSKNFAFQNKKSFSSVKYSLNLSSEKALGENNDETKDVYSIGTEDGISENVSADELKKDGIPSLESHKSFWANNSEISGLPDLIIVSDTSKASIIPSVKGDTGNVAYYLYRPASFSNASAFTAVYYEGSRYIGMDYVEKKPTETFARLKAENIPENTTRIRFIAFAETFDDGFKPAEVICAEIEYSKLRKEVKKHEKDI